MRPEVPAELSAAVARMMATRPEARFHNADEVVQALEPFAHKSDAHG